MTDLNKLKDPKTGSHRFKLWINQAEFDIEAARSSISNGYNEWAAYQAEQSVEKSLKSIIVQAGYIPPRIHKISVLIGYCNDVNEVFKNTKFAFRDIDAFTFISRYPFLIPGDKTPHELISKQDAERLIDQAQIIINKIKLILDHKPVVEEIESKAYEVQTSIDLNKRLDEIVEELKSVFEVKKVILFGSYARDFHFKEGRTLDILVVANTDLSFMERIIKAREVTRGSQPSIDPLVYTPEEFTTLVDEEGEGFLESAIAEGRVLFEA